MSKINELYRAKVITYERINGAEVTITKESDGWNMTCYYPQDDYVSMDENYPSLEAIIDQILDWEKEKLDAMVDAFTGWGSVMLPGTEELRKTIISKMVVATQCTMIESLEEHEHFDYNGINAYYIIHRVEEDENVYKWYYEATNSNEETSCSLEYDSLEDLFAEIAILEKENLETEQKILGSWASIPNYTNEQIREIIVSKIAATLNTVNV